jgi:hypothetical protein
MATDFERQERFLPDYWSLGGAATFERAIDSGASVGARVGGAMMVPTEDASYSDSESFAHYAAFVRALIGRARIGGDFSGIWIMTQPQLDFGEATTAYLTLSASLPEVPTVPEAYARIPLDDDLADPAFVLGARVRFGG